MKDIKFRSDKSEKMATREAYGKVLLDLGKENENLVVMDADLSGSTKTAAFAREFPERFFNMGIAEQNLYAAATGIALSGKTVCASTFAVFATGRAFEIIRNMVAQTNANVKICASHAGITTGEDGATHQSIEDIALMRGIPGMTVIVPSDGSSAASLIRRAVEMQGPCYVRLGRSAVPMVYEDDQPLEIGRAVRIRNGGDAAVIASGIMVNEAIMAADILAAEGIDVSVTDMHTIKPLDKDEIIDLARISGKIVTAEEHSIIGGLGSAVAEVLAEEAPAKLRRVGQKDCFGESGKPEELKKKYGMTAADIVSAVKELLGF